MSNEWLSPTEAQSKKLIPCFIEPKMTFKFGSEGIKSPLENFHDIFTHLGPGNKKILVRGMEIYILLKISHFRITCVICDVTYWNNFNTISADRGMGKTCVVTRLAWFRFKESGKTSNWIPCIVRRDLDYCDLTLK